MKNVWDNVWNKVHRQTIDRVGTRIDNHVWRQVFQGTFSQVRSVIGIELRNYIWKQKTS